MKIFHQARVGLAKARPVASVAVAWVGLFVVAGLVVALTQTGPRLARPQRLALDPFPSRFSDPRVHLTGHTEGRALVVLETGELTERTWADGRGRFSFHSYLPPTAGRLRVTAYPPKGPPVVVEHDLHWDPGTFEKRLDLCLASTRLGRLWVAGRATPVVALVIETDTGDILRRTVPDEYGVIDHLLPLPDPAPETVVLRDPNLEAGETASCQVVEAPDGFPLSRTTSVTDVPSAEEVYGPASTIGKTLSRSLATVTSEVVLPADHPYARLALAGSIPGSRFVDRTVGGLPILGPRNLLEARWLSLRPDEVKALQSEVEPEIRVRVEDGLVHVRVKQRLSPLYERLSLQPGQGNGIAEHPLLGERDAFTIAGAAPGTWRFSPPPTRVEPESATWRGPSDQRWIDAIRPIPPSVLDGLRRRTFTAGGEESPNVGEESLRDFLARKGQPQGGDPCETLWYTLLALAAPAAVIWLLTRHPPYTGLEHSKWLLTLSLLAATVLALPLASLVLDALPLFSPGLWHLALRWLAVVALATSPLYLPRIVATLERGAGEVQRSSRWEGTRIWFSTAWIAVVLLTLWLLDYLGVRATLAGRDTDTLHALLSPELAEAVLALPRPLLIHGLPLLVASVLLLLAGWRGWVFVAALGPAVWWAATPHDPTSWASWGLYAIFVLAALLLTHGLLARALPIEWRRRERLFGACALVVGLVVYLRAPPTLTLPAVSALLACGLLWTVLVVLAELAGGDALAAWRRHRWRTTILFFAAGLVVVWPFEGMRASFDRLHLGHLIGAWGGLLLPLVAVGLALLIHRLGKREGRRVLTPAALVAGTLFLAFFLVGPRTTWLHVPLPLFVAWAFARFFLFAGPEKQSARRSLETDPSADRRFLVAAHVQHHALRKRIRAAFQALHKKLEKADVEADDYEKKAAGYRRLQNDAGDGERSRLAFAVGDCDAVASLRAFVGYGLLLASVPIVISLYEYLPESRVSYPFPVLGFVAFLVSAVFKWGLYALFFGLFYASLRGETGLGKGLWLFAAIALPFASYRFVGAASSDEMLSFLFWVAQLFVFFGLLGLLAGDLRLLRKAGLGLRDLRALHPLPALYAFGSTVAAALVPAILAAIAGRLGEVVVFFMDVVLPRAASGG